MLDFERYNLALMVEAGFIYLGMQRFEEAKEVFEGVRVLEPNDDVPVVALGNVEFCKGNIKKAVRHYHDALEINENSQFAKVYLGEALFFDGKKDEAVELLNEVKKADPRGSAGGFAIALLDAIKQGFKPKVVKSQGGKKKKVSHVKKKTKSSS